MAEAFDEIFDSICKSEEESNAQYEYLQKLKDKIATTEKEAEEVENQCRNMETVIAKKIKRLANREVVLLSMDIRKKCLQDRNEELKAENKELTKTMKELKTRLKSSREKLCMQSDQFIEECDFFKKKPQINFIHEGFQHDNKVLGEENFKFTTACSSSEDNFPKQREMKIAEKDSTSLWDINLDEDQNWLKNIMK